MEVVTMLESSTFAFSALLASAEVHFIASQVDPLCCLEVFNHPDNNHVIEVNPPK
jgi:hypothetical protein